MVRIFSLYFGNESVKGDDVPFKVLVSTFHIDYQLVVETEGTLENFKAVHTEVLLIGGSKNPSFLKNTLEALNKVLPKVKSVELHGFGHSGLLDTGNSELVAQELRKFFL